jgi:hypothetical protein
MGFESTPSTKKKCTTHNGFRIETFDYAPGSSWSFHVSQTRAGTLLLIFFITNHSLFIARKLRSCALLPLARTSLFLLVTNIGSESRAASPAWSNSPTTLHRVGSSPPTAHHAQASAMYIYSSNLINDSLNK